ncbi:MAG: NAD-dependent epimerase/dehydratase family protein [Ilumatobacteraceae bacterium]
MRIVVTGATGNVGTSLVSLLGDDPAVDVVVGVARRRPAWFPPKVDWVEADVAVDDLAPIVAGADAVVHLSWLIQPARDVRAMWATNVVGTRRLADAVARSGVPALVAASSVGAYSPAPPGHVVDESWPTDGTPESTYSWQKALEERTLDVLAERRPACRVVRVRPALIFKRASARHVRNLFIGHLLPLGLLPVEAVARAVAHLPLTFQVVHAHDVATAIHRCLVTDVRGAFNLAAPGVLGHAVRLGPPLIAATKPLVGAAWRARLVPVDPGWLTLAASAPLMSTERATTELSWAPTRDAATVLRELLGGLRDDASFQTPPLAEQHLPTTATTTPAV